MRPSMQKVVDEVRKYGQVPTTEVWNTVTYWSDDQLLDLCDQHANTFIVRLLPLYWGWQHFHIEIQNTLRFEDDTLTVYRDKVPHVGTFTVTQRELSYATDQPKGVYHLKAKWFDLNEIMASLWEIKAAQRSDYIDLRQGTQRFNLEQEYKHCIHMRDYYRNQHVRTTKRGGRRWYSVDT